MNSSGFDPSDFFGEEWKFQQPPPPRFQPGDKVVCIKTPNWPGIAGDFTSIPQAGRLYAVRHCDTNDGLCLVGIIGAGSMENGGEIAFDAKCFITLSEYRTRLQNCRALKKAACEVIAFWKKAAAPDKPRTPKKRKPKP
jgi:hypothetical protein